MFPHLANLDFLWNPGASEEACFRNGPYQGLTLDLLKSEVLPKPFPYNLSIAETIPYYLYSSTVSAWDLKFKLDNKTSNFKKKIPLNI